MPLPRLFLGGIVASALVGVFLLLFFVQTKDVMILLFGLLALFMLWIVLLVVHVLHRGIPVRVVHDDKKP